jgi:hypothetical protein
MIHNSIFYCASCEFNISDIICSFSISVKQIPFPSGTPQQANSVVSENVMQPTPTTTISSVLKEQIKKEGGEEKKVKEKTEEKGIFNS